MSDALIVWLQASWALALAWLAAPYIVYIVGAFVGGYAIGASKNRTAIVELLRGLGAGLVAGLIVWAIQQIVVGGTT